MTQTSRERVKRALTFDYPDRPPRQLWALPYANNHFPEVMAEIGRRFPSDIGGVCNVYRPSSRSKGDPYTPGIAVDEWGCTFTNIQAGVHGEIKNPLLREIGDWRRVQPPYELLPADLSKAHDTVNRHCAGADLFISAGCCPRPWERYQFLRGSENAMMDVMDPDGGARELLRVIHEFFMKELAFWVTTDVDAIGFMDDWGSQRQLLIPPRVWRELFKPLYKDYCDMARAHGKFVFMHSDGYIREVYPDLVEIGVNALNSQVFCMDMPELARIAKGKMTFWGEIDRQHVLTAADPEVGRKAVREFCRHFYDPAGGVIAQFEFGAGANPATALALFDEWDKVAKEWNAK